MEKILDSRNLIQDFGIFIDVDQPLVPVRSLFETDVAREVVES